MTTIPQLVTRLIELNNGNASVAAKQLGSSPANLSRYRAGESRPRKSVEDRLRSLVEGTGDLLNLRLKPEENRLLQLEEAISETLNALREEFHRSSSIAKRQDVLDLVSVLVFAHVTSIDIGGRGLGTHIVDKSRTSSESLNEFVRGALQRHLPRMGTKGQDWDRFFPVLGESDEVFASALLKIFERDASAFKKLHESGRDDLINEVFSRFMSTSFVDEKEMGQYLTPPEVTRFMTEIGFHALSQDVREKLLSSNSEKAGVILDPSCGVGSFLAESTRLFHEVVRARDPANATRWIEQFLENNVVGIDKSERMLKLACINLGLFGASSANLSLANSLSRTGTDSQITNPLDGKVQLILTNPPFGATLSGADLIDYSISNGRNKVDSEILFLERYVTWTAPGGVIVTVVPDSILVNRGIFASLRQWLATQCNIEAVFSLPAVTFAGAGTSTKTSVLVLRKKGIAPNRAETYFGEAQQVGFDVVTRSGQRRRVRHARSDLPALLEEFKQTRPANIGKWISLPLDAERWDAGFHKEPEAVADTNNLPVSSVAELVDERRDPKRVSSDYFNYIEISDVDTRTGLMGAKRTHVTEAPSRARKLVRAGDVLVSTVRPERGAVSVVPPELDGAICSTGFAVLRCRGIHPGALAWLLKTEFVKQQMIRHNIGIAYPAIADVTCLNLVLPVNAKKLGELSGHAETLQIAQRTFETALREMLERIDAPESKAA